MTGLSPVLISLYVVNLINNYRGLHFSFQIRSFSQVNNDLVNLLETHYLLLIFIFLFLVTRWLVRYAIRRLSVGRIQLKSIKPGDTNFVPLLFSAMMPFYKLYNQNFADMIYIGGFLITSVLYGITMKSSFHFNLVLKLFLGYSHYEVATTGEVTYLMLSRYKLVNKNQVSEYISLTDYMLINTTKKT